MISFAEQFGELDSCCFEWSKDSLNEVLMRQFGDFQHVDFSSCQAVPVPNIYEWREFSTSDGGLRWEVKTTEPMFPFISIGYGKTQVEAMSDLRRWQAGIKQANANFYRPDDHAKLMQSYKNGEGRVVAEIGDRPASTAKPSLSALNRVAGEKVRGIGWCDA